MKKIRITDVAKAAGVSPATVSYVLSGNRPISKETKDRVNRIIRELNYRPDPNARAMKSRKTNTIGVLASDFAEISVSRIILSVEAVTCGHEYHLFFASGSEFGNNVQDAMDFLLRRKMDGVIVIFGVTSDQPVGEIDRVDIPLVSINRPINEQHPCVLPDNFQGGYCAAHHLVDAECTNLAIITGPDDRYSSRERARGFRAGLAEVGINLPEDHIYRGDYNYDGGYSGASRLLSNDETIDGIFCANDHTAAGAIQAAAGNGCLIPERLKVFGYDNIGVSAIWPTPISTISFPFEEMGRKSAEILLAMIGGRPHDTGVVSVPGKLVPRMSTARM